MSPARKPTRARILAAAYTLFYRQGFARANIDAIAQAANVSKRTLYYHFSSKDELVSAALENQHEHIMAQLASWDLASAQTGVQLVRLLFHKLGEWAETPYWAGSGFTRLAIELADLPGHPIKEAARRHKMKVEKHLQEHLKRLGIKDSETLAAQIFILMEGSMSLSLIHGGSSYFDVAAKTAESLVEISGNDAS